ncbi:MAG: hypothetical protein [Bacteriophage sp.]|nr:MAG: hypothetical protein [Bacteriophage sp.]
MMNATPKQTVLNDTPFYVIPKALMSAKTFTSKKTGEIVELTMIDKVVFMHLIDMISFHNSQGRTMHESMSAIADAVDTSAKSVSRSVSKLIEHGVVSATLVSKAKGYTYHAADVDQHWNRGDMTEGNKQRMRQPVVTAPVAPSEAIADNTPDVGMPDHMNAPVFDYSDVFSQMADSDSEPRVSVDMVEDEFLQGLGY